MAVNEQRFIQVNKHKVILKRIGKEFLLLHKERRGLFELNKTAAFILSRADGKTPVSTIVKGLCREFNVSDKKNIEQDAEIFIKECLGKGFLVLR